MSRTFRLRHLPQPEGGARLRRFVDSSVRHARYLAEEDFLSHLAHVELDLPCKLKGGPGARGHGWRQTHAFCLPRRVNILLSTHERGVGWTEGWTRTVSTYCHPLLGYGLVCVPSATKKAARKLIYRSTRREVRRKLRVVGWDDYGAGLSASSPLRRSGLEFDWDGLLFPDMAAELAFSAMILT